MKKRRRRREGGGRRRGGGDGEFCIFVLQLLYGLWLMANEVMPYAKIEESARCFGLVSG